MSEGLGWAREIADRLLLVVGLLALLGGVALVGVILYKPWWFVGTLIVLILLAVLAEGAYRVWDQTERDLEAVSPGGDMSARLRELAREARIIREDTKDNLDLALADYEHFNARARAEIRLHAHEFYNYWNTYPEGFKAGVPPQEAVQHLFDYAIEQLEHIADELEIRRVIQPNRT